MWKNCLTMSTRRGEDSWTVCQGCTYIPLPSPPCDYLVRLLSHVRERASRTFGHVRVFSRVLFDGLRTKRLLVVYYLLWESTQPEYRSPTTSCNQPLNDNHDYIWGRSLKYNVFKKKWPPMNKNRKKGCHFSLTRRQCIVFITNICYW